MFVLFTNSFQVPKNVVVVNVVVVVVDVCFVYKLVTGSEERSYLSVEGQVNSLIQQARDPGRLCNLFVGWQPYI
jgi:hypothetical protein